MTFDDMVVSATTTIAASPEAVYDIVSDITRVGEWSPETYKAEWVEPGARFNGTNKTAAFEWTTPCVVTSSERGKRFAFDVIGGEDGNGASWSWDIAAADVGSTLTQTFELGPSLGGFRGFGRGMDDAQIADLVKNRVVELESGIATSLAKLKALAEQS